MSSQIIVDIITTVGVPLIGTLTGFAIAFLKNHVGISKLKKLQTLMDLHKSVVKDIIIEVQDLYKGASGEEKFNVASKMIADKLTSLGLPIAQDEISSLIKTVLKTVKKDFGDAWTETVGQ